MNRHKLMTVLRKPSIASLYYLYDQFTTARAAGAVNGTAAEPVGGTRTVTDTNGKISIAGGVLDFATGEAVNDRVYYSSLARASGKALLARIIQTSGLAFGWDINTTGGINQSISVSATSLFVLSNDSSCVVGAAETAVPYDLALVLRATGYWAFIRGGLFTKWTLLWPEAIRNTTPMYPTVATTATGVFTADNIRVPKRLYIPVPLQSDGFSAATTDGAGNAEANGPVGNAYTNVGTWGVAGGVRSCSVLSGGLGFSYLPCSSSNVILDAAVTRSAGAAGLVARYVDAENYLIAYHDGTNAKLDKVVGGVTTNLVSAAATYSAGAVLRLILDGTNARLFYNNLAVGALVTAPASASLNHGLYTTDTGNSFDNLVVWARGTESQYAGLDSM